MPTQKKSRPEKPSRPRLSAEDRIAEYVDSPNMIHRLRQGKMLSAAILGNYGHYRTQASLGRKEIDGNCTCPSEYVPCKHVHALRRTWNENPDSFLDFDKFLEGLAKQSSAYLINAIEQIALRWPAALSVLGVPGFEEVSDSETDDYYYE